MGCQAVGLWSHSASYPGPSGQIRQGPALSFLSSKGTRLKTLQECGTLRQSLWEGPQGDTLCWLE